MSGKIGSNRSGADVLRPTDGGLTHLMIESRLIFDDLDSHFFTGVLSKASHDLPEGALAQHIPDNVSVPSKDRSSRTIHLLLFHHIGGHEHAPEGLQRNRDWNSS